MRRFVNPGKRIASFTRTFARMRWALMFDGVGVRGVLASRAINPDGDIDIEFYSPSDLGTRQVIISQQINLLGASEFYIESDAAGRLVMVVGATGIVLLTTAQGFEAGKKYRVRLIDTALTIWKTAVSNADAPLRTTSFTRGATREPAATTVIGAANNGSASSFARYFSGIQRDIKINGTRWPMADRNQAIQLPEPSGLDAELITQSVLENPATKGSQWTYLGGGRWQYIGDGTYNSLRFIQFASQPTAGFVQFEVENISGDMACAANNSLSVFNTTGVKRYFYTSAGASDVNLFEFKRSSGVVSCIVKNISFKPLGTCNPMTISNATSANWMQVVDDYVAKFRKVLRFDGVGTRGTFSNRAINPDGDIDIEWEQKTTLKADGNVFVSQCGYGANSTQEFRLTERSDGVLELIVGGVVKAVATSAQGYERVGRYKLSLIGTNLQLLKNGAVLVSESFVRGAIREPSALTQVGVRGESTKVNYLLGVLYNLKINGTLWPIADKNQLIQLPEPSGLGAELLNTSPFLEPNGYVNTIVTTGINSFKVLAPASGATRAAKAFVLPSVSETTILEFDFISKDPDALLSVFVRDGSVVGGGAVTFSGNISALGKHRFLVTNSSMVEKNILFAVNLPCTFEVRNISIKPLGTCNPLTLANVTSANWEDLEI